MVLVERLVVKRGCVIQYCLNYIQCVFMIIIIGSVMGDLFNVFCSIVYCKGIMCYFQYFCIVIVVVNCYYILW